MFYHRSDQRFAAGEVLLPASSTKHASRWSHVEAYRDDRVYVYESHYDDSFDHLHMSHHGRNVYRVEPLGEIETDPDGFYWVDRYMTTSACIVHVVRRG